MIKKKKKNQTRLNINVIQILTLFTPSNNLNAQFVKKKSFFYLLIFQTTK